MSAEISSSQIPSTPHEDGPYGNTKRSAEFTSENYKLEISNLPSSKFHVVKQIVERHYKITPHKIRLGQRKAYLAFLTEDDRDKAVATINAQDYRGQTLFAKPAAPRHDPLSKRLKIESQGNAEEPIEDEIYDEETAIQKLNAQVCPLWDKEYSEQLKIKENSMRSVLSLAKQIVKLSPTLKNDSPKLFAWTQENSKICCPFDGVEASPRINGYRNKCEFNVGRDGTVGFRLGRYKNGSERVLRPNEKCPIVNDIMLQVIDCFQAFIKDGISKLQGFDHVTHNGHLRQLTIRTNEKKECLVIVDMHPQDLSESDLETEMKFMVEKFKTIPNIVSVYVNISEKNHLTGSDKTLKLIDGESHLFEYLNIGPDNPIKFRIGPTSFFQVNTKAAEVLYDSIREFAQLNSKTLLLDVGCGTGTIGLSLAKNVSHVLGIEIVESAIDDAKLNAKLNGITNVSFVAGKAEDLINECILIMKNKLTEQNNEGDIVAIVDPPRVGFNNSFIKSIRASNIRKIIYVACDPKANTNLVSLCRPKSKAYQGDPFVPTRAKAFDLFPHTKFCELLLVYERLSDKNSDDT